MLNSEHFQAGTTFDFEKFEMVSIKLNSGLEFDGRKITLVVRLIVRDLGNIYKLSSHEAKLSEVAIIVFIVQSYSWSFVLTVAKKRRCWNQDQTKISLINGCSQTNASVESLLMSGLSKAAIVHMSIKGTNKTLV